MYLEQMKEIDPVSIRPTTESADQKGATSGADGATFFFDDFKANRQVRVGRPHRVLIIFRENIISFIVC